MVPANFKGNAKENAKENNAESVGIWKRGNGFTQ
jgi:hypothetical protein